jgi:hypothetical protein
MIGHPMRLAPRQTRRSLVAVLAVFGLLVSGCGGRVAGNGPVDASSGGNGSMGTAVDGSSDGPVSGSMSDGGTGKEDGGVTDAEPITEAGGDGAMCMTGADCNAGYHCGFLEDDSCIEIGTCFPAPDAMCDEIELRCACDGTSINLICNGLPDGYTLKPVPIKSTTYTGDCEWATAIEPRN